MFRCVSKSLPLPSNSPPPPEFNFLPVSLKTFSNSWRGEFENGEESENDFEIPGRGDLGGGNLKTLHRPTQGESISYDMPGLQLPTLSLGPHRGKAPWPLRRLVQHTWDTGELVYPQVHREGKVLASHNIPRIPGTRSTEGG